MEEPSLIDIRHIALERASCNGLATGSAWVGGASGGSDGRGGGVEC